jgi:hypothetical protein
VFTWGKNTQFGGRKLLYVWERIEEDMVKDMFSGLNGTAMQ